MGALRGLAWCLLCLLRISRPVLLAGQLANQRRLTWESSRDGPKAANYLGCITQVGALADSYSFADMSADVVVGGWDVVPTPLGDALYESRVNHKLTTTTLRSVPAAAVPDPPSQMSTHTRTPRRLRFGVSRGLALTGACPEGAAGPH